jgi:hypothetical protein
LIDIAACALLSQGLPIASRLGAVGGPGLFGVAEFPAQAIKTGHVGKVKAQKPTKETAANDRRIG